MNHVVDHLIFNINAGSAEANEIAVQYFQDEFNFISAHFLMFKKMTDDSLSQKFKCISIQLIFVVLRFSDK